MIICLLKTLLLIIFLNQHSCAEVEAYVLQPQIMDSFEYSSHTDDDKKEFSCLTLSPKETVRSENPQVCDLSP